MLKLPPSLKAQIEKRSALIVTASLCVFGAAIVYWRIIRGYTPPVSYVKWPEPPDWVQSLYALRWIVRAAQVLAGAALVYVEWAEQSLSRWLRAVLENRTRLIILLIVVGALLGSYLLQPGNFGAGDQRGHVSAPWVIQQSIKEGHWLPFWTTYANLGAPFMQFYNPAYHYFIALLAFIVPDFYEATEIGLLALHVLSVLAMYLYVQQLTGSRTAGLVAGVAYGASFFREHIVAVVTQLPTGLFFVLWPLQFYLIERLIGKSDNRWRLGAALAGCLGLAIWTHVLYGGWLLASGISYALIRLLVHWRELPPQRILEQLAFILPALTLGALTAAYRILPPLSETGLTGMPNPVGASVGTAIKLKDVFVFKNSYLTDWYGGFIGNTIVALALLSIIVVIAVRYSKAWAMMVLAIAPLFFAFAPAYLPDALHVAFNILPIDGFIYGSKPSGRLLIAALGPLAALVGMLAYLLPEVILRRLNLPAFRRWIEGQWIREIIGVIVILIILVELTPASLWVSFKYPDDYVGGLPGRWPLIEVLAKTDVAQTRALDLEAGSDPSFLIPTLTGHPSLFGMAEDTPAATSGILSQLMDLLNADVSTGQLRSETASLLYQLDIGYLITNGAARQIAGLEEMARTEEAALWRVPHHSPIVATSRPTDGNRVEVTVPAGGDVPVAVSRYDLTNSTVALDFSLLHRAFVQLAYTAYPYQKVTLDDERIAATPTALGLIGFWAEAGQHTVVVIPELSPLRQWTLAISALASLIALGIMLIPTRKPRG